MIKPISPKEVINKKNKEIPDFVFEAFNDLIAKNFNNGRSTVYQKDVVKLIIEKSEENIKSKTIYENHWLDVEEIYRKQGWVVKYDKPAYNESYEASFEFSVK